MAPACCGPVKQPPLKQTVGISKYRPYSCTSRSAAALETPNSEWVEASIDIEVSMPR
jgi:hypothetical protein